MKHWTAISVHPRSRVTNLMYTSSACDVADVYRLNSGQKLFGDNHELQAIDLTCTLFPVFSDIGHIDSSHEDNHEFPVKYTSSRKITLPSLTAMI